MNRKEKNRKNWKYLYIFYVHLRTEWKETIHSINLTTFASFVNCQSKTRNFYVFIAIVIMFWWDRNRWCRSISFVYRLFFIFSHLIWTQVDKKTNKKFLSSFFSSIASFFLFPRSKCVPHLLSWSGSSFGWGKRKNMLRIIWLHIIDKFPFFLSLFPSFAFAFLWKNIFIRFTSETFGSRGIMSRSLKWFWKKNIHINILFVCLLLSVNGWSPSLIYLLLLCFNVLLLLLSSLCFHCLDYLRDKWGVVFKLLQTIWFSRFLLQLVVGDEHQHLAL